ILIFMVLGAYSINSSAFDVLLMAFFGLVGYFLRKLDFPLTPAVLTLILGPLMEKSLRKAMDISQGDFSILWSSPISAVVLTLAIIVLISPMLRFLPIGRNPLRGEDSEV
ncbi:MAG TPA: tripartite tricarboxylate transporter permease, partial [Chloroflexota bacterium]|nr:tripartite tricarboxylate transporter permease [Chloroflexota bacterium]